MPSASLFIASAFNVLECFLCASLCSNTDLTVLAAFVTASAAVITALKKLLVTLFEASLVSDGVGILPVLPRPLFLRGPPGKGLKSCSNSAGDLNVESKAMADDVEAE